MSNLKPRPSGEVATEDDGEGFFVGTGVRWLSDYGFRLKQGFILNWIILFFTLMTSFVGRVACSRRNFIRTTEALCPYNK